MADAAKPEVRVWDRWTPDVMRYVAEHSGQLIGQCQGKYLTVLNVPEGYASGIDAFNRPMVWPSVMYDDVKGASVPWWRLPAASLE
jgi:hypothetical protein